MFRCLRESGLTAFFTRSSAANIPVNMTLCEKLGLDKDIYSVSIPLGATINMDGAAITITIMTLAAANTLGMDVSVPAAVLLSVMSALGACGASGVAAARCCVILWHARCSASPMISLCRSSRRFHHRRHSDSVETALNSAGDVEFAATAEYHQCSRRANLSRHLWVGNKRYVISTAPVSSAKPGLHLCQRKRKGKVSRRQRITAACCPYFVIQNLCRSLGRK